MNIQFLYDRYLSSNGINIDTRSIESNQLFFGIRGEHFDGNSFAAQALEKGALAAIVDDPAQHNNDKTILVPDTLAALQELGKHHRQQVNPYVIGITGTNGKTTSKELINTVLAGKYKTFATPGNLNNHIGVPLSLLKMSLDTEYAIIEMGANHLGEIRDLCQICRPNAGVITNIAKAHLEGFGNLETIRKTKAELYDFVEATQGLVFVNNDYDYLISMAERIPSRVTYGSSKANYKAALVNTNPFLEVSLRKELIKTKLTGAYNYENILLAIAVGSYFDVESHIIKDQLEAYIPDNNRSALIKKGLVTFVLDAYNANPASMKASIQSFGTMKGRKVLVLGDMKELGDHSQEEHESIVTFCVNEGFEEIYLVGPEFEKTSARIGISYLSNVEEAIENMDWKQFSNASILIKGSRKMELEKLVPEN